MLKYYRYYMCIYEKFVCTKRNKTIAIYVENNTKR